MFSAAVLLPYRQFDYQTNLTPEQIGQRLSENVITGFTLYSSKPYYGDITPYSFSVGKTSSKLKKQSLGPKLEGTYRYDAGKMRVTISVRPHTIWLITLFLFAFPISMFTIRGLTEIFKTGDIALLLNLLFPSLCLYGVFWVIFQSQSNADIRFWEHTLQLERLPS